MKYSLYSSNKSVSGHQVSVAELLERIGTKELKDKCARIAAHILAGEEKEANQLKNELPCIVVAELYKEGAPRKKGTGMPTGLFMMDWDDCHSMEELTELQNKVKALAISHPVLKDLIVAAHTSPRLHGVHVFCRWIEGCRSIEECQAQKWLTSRTMTRVVKTRPVAHTSCIKICSLYRIGEQWNATKNMQKSNLKR